MNPARRGALITVANDREVHAQILKGIVLTAGRIGFAATREGEAAAQRMVERMRDAAPVDSGELRESIDWRREGDEIVVEADASDALDVFYARFVEYGTRAGRRGARTTVSGRARKVYRTHPGTEAQPFFYDTAREVLAEFRVALEDAIDEE